MPYLYNVYPEIFGISPHFLPLSDREWEDVGKQNVRAKFKDLNMEESEAKGGDNDGTNSEKTGSGARNE